MSRSPHGIEPDLEGGQQAAGYRVLRRALPIRAEPVGCESRRVPQRSGLDRLGLKVKEAQELTRFRVQCDPRTFAEKAERDAVRCLRDRQSDVRQLGGLAYARCAMSCPCTENCLTKRSSSGRTHREHEGRSDPRVPDRRWVSCRLLGEHWQVKHDVAPEKCALPQKLVLYPSHATESRARYRMTL
jgi:hypothetical protein